MRRAHCTFLLCFAFVFAVLSKADQPINKFQPHVHESFTPGLIQQTVGSSCAYTVVISTSCLSPKYTTDQISIIFGDAFGNQVYDSKLVNPFTITFEQCSTNTFQVTGSCSLEICYLYFYRNGTVGWIPQSVEIYGSFSTPAVFFFNSTTVPEGEWYGINKCQNFPGAPPPSSALRLQIIPGWFLYLILGILATSIFLSY
ncbi:hypothetical protein Peur_070169 [Populus x canadensis]|uniref:Embryo-specific 3 n=1 Tax=Populus deltoides TaxID=3696 RepID=A0A8T2X079_POPDE|nr:hypothetical protein H0E87_025420 [Populus deltoides]